MPSTQKESMFIKSFWIFISIILGGLRLSGDKGKIFKAIAHVVVGGFFGAYLVNYHNVGFFRSFYGPLAVALSILEIVAFVISKKREAVAKDKINSLKFTNE